MTESHLEILNDFTSHMEAATKEACSALSQAADDMAHFHDTHCKEAPLYEVRDKVSLNGQNITTTHPMKKLDHKWLSPYVVDKVISQMPTGSNYIHPLAKLTQSSQLLGFHMGMGLPKVFRSWVMQV